MLVATSFALYRHAVNRRSEAAFIARKFPLLALPPPSRRAVSSVVARGYASFALKHRDFPRSQLVRYKATVSAVSVQAKFRITSSACLLVKSC